MFGAAFAKVARGFRLTCGLSLLMAAAASVVPLAQAIPAVGNSACPGVVKVSYGTFSDLIVKGMTCGAGKTFVLTTGGVPRGWKCTGTKTSSTTTVDKCVSGAKSIEYHFLTK